MGSWTCGACTFLNTVSDASECEICGTERLVVVSSSSANAARQSQQQAPPSQRQQGDDASTESAKKTTTTNAISKKISTLDGSKQPQRQATLFGGLVPKQEEEKKGKKRERPAGAPVRNDKATKKVASKPSSSSSSSINAAKKATSKPKTSSSSASSFKSSKFVVGKDVPLDTLLQKSQHVMKQVFGIDELRYLQPRAIRCALSRQSQVVVMATGGGKSLCYQLPACVLGGTSIVISPLKALIEDQVSALLRKGVAAAYISSSQTEKQNLHVLERLAQKSLQTNNNEKKAAGGQSLLQPPAFPHVTILYCTPEQVQTARFRNVLQEMFQDNRLALFGIDEAHCISSWGHDFRKAYLHLGWLRQRFPTVPLLACTATATPKVLQDVISVLHLKDCPCHVGSFDRKNVFYKVRYKDVLDAMLSAPGSQGGGALADLQDFIRKQHAKAAKTPGTKCSGIVYVHKQRDTLEIASAINQSQQQQKSSSSSTAPVVKIRAAAYHGGMKDKERVQVQQAWTEGKVQIVVATISFGMGIDLSHVRYVVHWSLAKNIESFYQESGRAGRDGLPSYSLVYYSKQDASLFEFLARQKARSAKKGQEQMAEASATRALEALEKMVEYCLQPGGCRRRYLLRFFGEADVDPATVCRQSCDYCMNPTKVTKAMEAASAVTDLRTYTRKARGGKQDDEWNGQWSKPHGDDKDDNDWDQDDGEHDWNDSSSNGLQITSSDRHDDGGDWRESSDQAEAKPSLRGFTKASSILQKYEAIECQENQSNGFVHFKKKVTAEDGGATGMTGNKKRKRGELIIPQHLLGKMTKQSQKSTGVTSNAASTKPSKPSAKDAAAEVARLRAELEQARAQRAALVKERSGENGAATGEPKRKPPPPPPPPSISFTKKKKKRHH